MDGAVNTVTIAASVAIGTSLLAGFFSVWVATRSSLGTAATRDTTVSLMFAAALLLILLNAIAGAFIAASGMAYVGVLKAAILLTAAFAVVGMAFGLIRGLRSGGDRNAKRMKRPLSTPNPSIQIR